MRRRKRRRRRAVRRALTTLGETERPEGRDARVDLLTRAALQRQAEGAKLSRRDKRLLVVRNVELTGDETAVKQTRRKLRRGGGRAVRRQFRRIFGGTPEREDAPGVELGNDTGSTGSTGTTPSGTVFAAEGALGEGVAGSAFQFGGSADIVGSDSPLDVVARNPLATAILVSAAGGLIVWTLTR